MAEDETRESAVKEDDRKMKLMKKMAERLASRVTVERFAEPKTVQATAAVSFNGDTVYCTDENGEKLAKAAVDAFAVHLGCIIAHKMSTPEGILDLLMSAKKS